MSKSTNRVKAWRAGIKSKADLFEKVEQARLKRIDRAKPELIEDRSSDTLFFLKDYVWFIKEEYKSQPTATHFPEKLIATSEEGLLVDWGNTPPNMEELLSVSRAVHRPRPGFNMPRVAIDHMVHGLGPMPPWKLHHLFLGAVDGGVIRSFAQDDELDAEQRGEWEASSIGTPDQA